MNGVGNFPWDEAAMDMLRALRERGDSAGQIARAMSVARGRRLTRNAVIGKALRLGLPASKGRPSKPIPPPRALRAPRVAPPPPPPEFRRPA